MQKKKKEEGGLKRSSAASCDVCLHFWFTFKVSLFYFCVDQLENMKAEFFLLSLTFKLFFNVVMFHQA